MTMTTIKTQEDLKFQLELLQALREGILDRILDDVPLDRATPRWEYRTNVYGPLRNTLPHGPYLYLYWKDLETKKLKKRYVGKYTKEQYKKRVEEFTSQTAQLGNQLAAGRCDN
jgi:hypothetical protein